jgi:carboxylesterase
MSYPENSTPKSIDFYSGSEHEPFVLGAGNKAGALLIHGFPGTPAEMRPLANALAADGWAAHGILLPGFGRDIARLGEMRRGDWLQSAAQIWEEMQYRHRSSVLVGYSMGAAIALQLAAKRPPDALVLLAPFWTMDDWRAAVVPLLKYVIPTFAPFANANLADPEFRAMLAEMAPELDLDDEAVQRALREQIVLPTAVLDEIRLLGREAFQRAARVTAPTLVLHGADDEVVTTSATRRLVSELGGRVAYRELNGDHQFPRSSNGAGEIAAEMVRSFLKNGAVG